VKGKDTIIDRLNFLLADELTAISQYMVHSEMCANWGYGKLADVVEKRAIDEMKHAEKLIGRILFLEGKPVVNNLNPMHIGAEIPAQIDSDCGAEDGAIHAYNDAIRLCTQEGDSGTRELLEDILEDEEEHIDWLENQQTQIAQMGLPIYLLAQRD
jgi:bacterioferritin